MKKLISKLTVIGMMLMSMVAVSFAMAPAANAGDSPNIIVCHSNGSIVNPYSSTPVSKTAIVKGTGHGGHDNDIIPPFEYAEKKGDPLTTYPGKNWTAENQALYENSCVKPLKLVKPVPPTYNPGTCLSPEGSLTLHEQPEGIINMIDPQVVDGKWMMAYTHLEGYTFGTNDGASVFTFDIIGPNSSDPNWDTETGGCGLPEVGAGNIEAFYPYIGGAFALGLLLILGNVVTRRRNA